MRKGMKKAFIFFMCCAMGGSFSGNFTSIPIKAAQVKEEQTKDGQKREAILSAYRTFLKKHEGNYFRVDTIKGEEMPILFVADYRESDTKTTHHVKIYQAKQKKQGSSQYVVKKIGEAECTSSAYDLFLNKKGELVYGSHHYTGYLSMKKGVLLNHYYYSKSDKKGKETFFHRIYKNNKKVKEEKVTSAIGNKKIYDVWDEMGEQPFIFYKNGYKNRLNYIK